jgi:hypothetical protein
MTTVVRQHLETSLSLQVLLGANVSRVFLGCMALRKSVGAAVICSAIRRLVAAQAGKRLLDSEPVDDNQVPNAALEPQRDYLSILR